MRGRKMLRAEVYRKSLLLAIPIASLASAPFLLKSAYFVHFFSLLFLFLALASAWNILGGYAGQVCLGTGAFFGIGAYSMMLSLKANLPLYASIIAGGIAASCLALLIIPLFRLRGIYFAIGTLFLPDIIRTFVLYFSDVTGGAMGIYLPLIRDPLFAYTFLLAVSVCTILVTHFLVNSRYGLAMRAIRDDQDAGEMYGINATKLKTVCLLTYAFLCGLAGSGYALYMGFLDPYTVFHLTWSIAPVFMCIIGGQGTIWGPIVGSIIYVVLSEQLTFIVGELHLLVFGGILIAVILLAPYGIVGALKRLSSNFVRGWKACSYAKT
jgi:branched-chain amino acid transport system permease protein